MKARASAAGPLGRTWSLLHRRPLGHGESLGRQIVSRDPFYALWQFTIGLHEFLDRLPGFAKWNEQANRERRSMQRVHELADTAQVAFRNIIVAVPDPAIPLPEGKINAQIGISKHVQGDFDLIDLGQTI